MGYVIEDTRDEIKRHADEFNGHMLRVIVDRGEEIDYAAGIPAPPFAIQDREHLIELLERGIASPRHELIEECKRQRFRELEDWAAQQE